MAYVEYEEYLLIQRKLRKWPKSLLRRLFEELLKE